MKLNWFFAAAVAATLSLVSPRATAQENPPDPAGQAVPPGCPPGTRSMRPPKYPRKLVDQNAVVYLVLELDRCGFVVGAMLERTEADDAFVRAALEAAKQWRLPAGRREEAAGPGLARVPVEFISPIGDSCEDAQPAQPEPSRPTETMLANGTTKLELTLDRCGRVEAIAIEQGSGYSRLDFLAVEAAKRWRFTPELHEGKGVPSLRQVSVAFPSLSEETVQKAANEWRRKQVAVVARAADGSIDGNVRDPAPIEGASVADIVAGLESDAIRLYSDLPAIRKYRDRDGSVWFALDPTHELGPSIVRKRLVSDGEKSFFAAAGRCGAVAPGGCAKFEEMLKTMFGPQKAYPPVKSPYDIPQRGRPADIGKIVWRRQAG